MAMQSLTSEIRRGGRGSMLEGDLFFSRTKSGGKARDSINFRISPKLVKESRLMDGDRVDVRFDFETRSGVIVRTKDDNGRRLSANGSKCLRCRFTPSQEATDMMMPKLGSCPAESVTVDDQGILFVLPKQ